MAEKKKQHGGKSETESWFCYLVRRAIQRIGIDGKPWTGAVPSGLRDWYDFLFLPHEYQRFQGWIARCAPADWAESLMAICEGREYKRSGHRLYYLYYNAVLFIAVHRMNRRFAARVPQIKADAKA